MRHALQTELDEIYKHFAKRRDIFPHVRKDKLARMLEANEIIYEDGVIITYSHYKKRTRIGSVSISAGSIVLHQILNSAPKNGKAGILFERFVAELVKPANAALFLAVRKDNYTACKFYEKHGMHITGSVNWKNNELPGVIYKLHSNDLFTNSEQTAKTEHS